MTESIRCAACSFRGTFLAQGVPEKVGGWLYGLMDGPTSFVPCFVGECLGVGSIELCVEARTDIYQANTCILHMHAHTKWETRTHANTCAMGCKAMHACACSFTYTVVSYGL